MNNPTTNATAVQDVAYFTDNTTGITYNFPFNIDSLTWNYVLNTQSFSTIGGRVTQLLSVQITTMTVQGEAGSRPNLINLYQNFKTIQDNQNQNKVSTTFAVPSKGITQRVWLEQMQLGWDITTVTYPYFINFEADYDISGIATNAATANALSHIVKSNGGETGYNGTFNGIASANAINVNLPN